MWISYALNKHMTPISVHKCDTCETIFTVCPAVDENRAGWDSCMSTTCGSYDRMRDADRMFAEGKVFRR